MTEQSLADRLEHAIATASNDDYSRVGTRERERHVERIGVMQDCLASLRQSGEAIERAAKVADAEAEQLIHTAERAVTFSGREREDFLKMATGARIAARVIRALKPEPSR